MENIISFKKVLIVFLIINVALLLLRLRIFPDQPALFHIVVFIGTFGFFVLAWKILLILHKGLNKIMPVSLMPFLRLTVQVGLTTAAFTVFSTIMFKSVSYLFKVDFGGLISNFIYLLNFLISIIFNLVLFGAHYFYAWKRDLVHRANLEKEQAIVRYEALRNQLNPHFLFNALTSLNSLIFDNQQLASDFLQQLSKVYRYILQNKDNNTVTVQTEMAFVAHYIGLLNTRFKEALDIQINIADEDLEKGMVPVVSQTLIENALKHNTVSPESPLKIRISTSGTHFIVSNNLQKKKQVQGSNKQGLENLKTLYAYLSEVPVESEETAETFTVRIPLI